MTFDQTIDEAFPAVDPGIEPFGSRVLVQIRAAKSKSKGGIHLPEETRQTIQHNSQVARVVAVGPLAFKNRDTMKEWPEGAWCKPGDFVRIPKFGGDRYEVLIGKKVEDGVTTFAIFDDLNIIARITCDPLSVITFV